MYLSWIELSDGLAATMPDLSDECLNPPQASRRWRARRRPLRHGGPGGRLHRAVGGEVLSAELRSMPMREMYRQAYQATAAQFRPVPGGVRP